MAGHRVKLALVCTGGGHFEQMVNLEEFYGKYPHFWITAPGVQSSSFKNGELMYFIKMGHFKEPWTYLVQLPRVLSIFLREKPTHLLSTGSGRIVLVPYLLSLLCKARFIHIETFSYVNKLTKMGSLLAKMGCPVFTQWKKPNQNESTFIGPVFKKEAPEKDLVNQEGLVFVTVGTRDEPYPRIIQAVENLQKEGFIQDRIIVQAGRTAFRSDWIELFDFASPLTIEELVKRSRLVITQESAGLVTKCLKYHKRFIVMPREYDRGELPAKSDMREDLHLKLEELGYTYVVHDVAELKAAMNKLDKLKVGFEFDNSLAIDKLTKLVNS